MSAFDSWRGRSRSKKRAQGLSCKLFTYFTPRDLALLQIVPAAKLVLGIPAYGRSMQSPGQTETYADLFFKFGPLKKELDIVGGFYFNG
jgi:GH18 family chitinase